MNPEIQQKHYVEYTRLLLNSQVKIKRPFLLLQPISTFGSK